MKKRYLIPTIIFGLLAIIFIFLGVYLIIQAYNPPQSENIGEAVGMTFAIIIEIYFSVWCFFLGAISIITFIPLLIATCKSKKTPIQ